MKNIPNNTHTVTQKNEYIPNNIHTETLKLTAHLLTQHPEITASKYRAHASLQGCGPLLNRFFANSLPSLYNYDVE